MKNRESLCSRHGNLWPGRHLEEWGRTKDGKTYLYRHLLSPLSIEGLWTLCAAVQTAAPGRWNEDDNSNCYIITYYPLFIYYTLCAKYQQGTTAEVVANSRGSPFVGKEFGSQFDLRDRESRYSNALKTLQTLPSLGCLLSVETAMEGGLARILRAQCCVSLDKALSLSEPQISHLSNGQRIPALPP